MLAGLWCEDGESKLALQQDGEGVWGESVVLSLSVVGAQGVGCEGGEDGGEGNGVLGWSCLDGLGHQLGGYVAVELLAKGV